MRSRPVSVRSRSILAILFLVPALHPLFIPLVGAPSHLLWWVHVLPVALLSFHGGRAAAGAAVAASGALVALGEVLFGAGYGVSASPQTVLLLSLAVTGTNLLVAWFALYARRSSRRYRVLTDHVTMGVALLDAEGRVRSTNQALREMVGATAEDLRDRLLDDILSVPQVGSVKRLAALGGWTGEVRLRDADGERRIPAFVAAIPEAEGDGHQVLVLDRSLEVAREKELERQGKLAALGEALAGVAHELNNPLTVILAHAQLGVPSPDDPEHAETLGIVEEQAERMRDLIQELLGFSRDRAPAERVRLGPLVERLVRVQQMAAPGGVTLEHRLAYRGPVRARAAKVEQILLNLVANAAYAVGHGGGGRVLLSVERAGEQVWIRVEDDGPGIPQDLLGRIFEPFVTTKPEGEGTGLGLAIARRLALGWGGDLEAENRSQGGARFTLTLPIAPDATAPIQEGTGAPAAAHPPPAVTTAAI